MTNAEFKQKRESLGYTQQQMAERLHVTKRTIFNYEQDGYKIPWGIAWWLDTIITLEKNLHHKA